MESFSIPLVPAKRGPSRLHALLDSRLRGNARQQVQRRLIHIRLVAALRFQIGDEFGGFGGAAATLLRNDICERGLDVLGHAERVAADIDVGAFTDP